MKLTSGQKLIAVAAVVVVLAALAVFLLIVPQITKLSSLDSEISQAEMDTADAKTLLEQRQAIKSRSAETETKFLRLSNELPESPELPSLIISLQDVVNDSGLDFSRLEPQEPVDMTTFSAVPLDITVRGSWQDTVDLLQRLRRMTRQIRIVGFGTNWVPPENTTAEQTSTVEVPNIVETVVYIEVYTMARSEATTETIPAPSQ